VSEMRVHLLGTPAQKVPLHRGETGVSMISVDEAACFTKVLKEAYALEYSQISSLGLPASEYSETQAH
jgi:hypothetical protein